MARILGIDPGLTRCGVGVVELGRSRKLSLIHVGVLLSPKDALLADRIGSIGLEIAALLDKHKPEVVAIERVFSQQNVSTVMGTAQISGVAIFLANQRGIPVVMHTPTEVKAAVTGSGRASKAQVGEMVLRLLGLKEVPKPADAADALAIAICQAFRGSTGSKYTEAQKVWHNAEELAKTKRRR